MNVLSAATPAASRPTTTTPEAPAAAANDFAALLAGLGSAEPDAPAVLQEPVDAPTDQPPPDGTAQSHDGLGVDGLGVDVLVVPTPAAVPPPAPVVEAPAVAETLLAVPAPPRATGTTALAAPPALPCAEHPATTGPAALGEPDLRRLVDPLTTGPALDERAPAAVTPAVAQVPASASGGPAATPSAPVTPTLSLVTRLDRNATTTSATTPSDGAAGTTPDAVRGPVRADRAGDLPGPVLGVRSSVPPVAPTTAAQAAGTTGVEGVLPTDAQVAAVAAPPVDAPQPDVPLAAPTSAAGPAPVVAGAEAGVTGPQPSDPRAAAPITPAPPAAPPPVTQVVQLLAPVLAGPDGSYSMSLQLYPEELGAVQVEVLLRGGEIRLAMHAPDQAAQAALRSALPDLRADLLAGGLSATSLSVDDGRSGQPSSDRSPEQRPNGWGDSPGRRPDPYRGGSEPASRPPTSHADTALDLRM